MLALETGATAAIADTESGGPSQTSRPMRRWQVLRTQIAAGDEPCFMTERRYTCVRVACIWREECRVLRAVWRR